LDGPNASPDEIRHALRTVEQGGLFGYRFLYPAMRAGKHEVFWHRPLAAYLSAATGQPAVLPDAPAGYLTTSPWSANTPRSAAVVDLWPHCPQREPHRAAVELFAHTHDPRPHIPPRNIRKILDTYHLLGKPLPRSLARQLLDMPR